MNIFKKIFAELLGLFFDETLLTIGLLALMVISYLAMNRDILDSVGGIALLVGGALGMLLIDLWIEHQKRSRRTQS